MTEQSVLERDEPSDWSPLKTVLSMLIGAALGASVYVVAELRHQHAAPPPPAAAPAQVVEAPSAEPPKEVAAKREETKPEETKPAEPEDPKARALAARTAAEQALLDEARTQLESSNAVAASATLDRMKKKFAHGSLVQERELLRIEVYKARGQMPAAKRAARKFAKAYPENPHIDELAALTKI